MKENYPIQWLDILISNSLNPNVSNIEKISKEQSTIIISTIQKEVLAIQSKIKFKVFSFTREKHIRLFIVNHYKSLQILLDQVATYNNHSEYNRSDLKQILETIENEIQALLSFIELWYPHYLHLNKAIQSSKSSYTKKFSQKILCNLSTDQTAILLRAADELQILVARSMRSVFKAIVPHLSTPYKKNLSYDSVRSKSYNIEESDKEIVLEQLHRLIKKIQEY